MGFHRSPSRRSRSRERERKSDTSSSKRNGKPSGSGGGGSRHYRTHDSSSRGESSRKRYRSSSDEGDSPRRSQQRNHSPNRPERNRNDLDEEFEQALGESFDIDAQQRKLDLLMEQRKKRVELWRAEQSKKKTVEEAQAEARRMAEESRKEEAPVTESKKKWSLEDEGDDDDEDDSYNPMQEEIDDIDLKLPEKKEEADDLIGKIPLIKNIEPKKEEKKPISALLSKPAVSKLKSLIKSDNRNDVRRINSIKRVGVKKQKEPVPEPEPMDDDMDPLDAFMMTLRGKDPKKVVKKEDKKVAFVVGVAKKPIKKEVKGELLEQNQDAMEYSSEEELTSTDDLAAMNTNLQAKQTKKITTITMEEITFSPYTKNFYIEVPELAKMTSAEVNAYREELEGIKVKGKGCPKPIKTWAQCGVSGKVLDVLKKYNYEKPSPIQCQAIPTIMSGRDVIGIAKTGSGKTLAFLIPLLRHIDVNSHLDANDGPIGLIMTPTRELATQIWSEFRKFKSLGLRVVCVYGGTPISDQISKLKSGAEIIVCTPGRMIDILAANGGRVTNLRQCTYLVLDEADRMFDMGFRPQVEKILDIIRPDHQTIMFSATFPRSMEALARRILNKPIEIQVGGRSVVCKDVEQQVILIDEENKFLKLLQILGENLEDERSALIFVDKQESADGLLKELMHAGYACLALHGGIDQQDRDSTISDFKNNRIKVLIATSVAARGLDVKSCYLVVNYDCPNHYEDYVHRCGRTGRAGNKGFAWTFITPEDARYAGEIVKALKLSENPVPADVERLFEEYKSKLELEGKRILPSSGFSGCKGFKFTDDEEKQHANEKKKLQKAALGMQDSDEEDAEDNLDQTIEKILAPKKTVKSVSSTQAPTASTSTPSTIVPQNASEKLELARLKASQIKIGSKTTSTTEAFLKGNTLNLGVSTAISAKSIAEQIAERIHAKMNYLPKDSEYNDEGDLIKRADDDGDHGQGEVFQRFEEELEINDFPQQARWRVTSKEALAQISEYSEAGITVRGTYIPANQANKSENKDERKLYLAIEGTSEQSVKKAKAEIIRLIKEELIKLQNTYQPINKGRYKVV
ncbi:pre-mRNA processing factor 5 [Brevipalpus obovatus]|uniref:pre-mRNA processing factor 5 n=1 Tax=Brevipalpus obovatus TaxID=246614 RepID=UPI003D9E8D49